MDDSYKLNAGEAILGLLQTIGALMFSIVYVVESFIKMLIPRSFRRHSVEGQIVLITGAGSGIGRSVALRLAKRGAKIISWDVNTEGEKIISQFQFLALGKSGRDEF